MPQKQPKRARLWLGDGSCIRLRPKHRNHVWSWDFVMARTEDGRAIKILTLSRLNFSDHVQSWFPASESNTLALTEAVVTSPCLKGF